MIMILGGLATILIFGPLAMASDPLVGWWTMGAGTLAVLVGGYAELYSK